MKHDNVIQIEKPETITKDLLTEILQKGSQRLLAIAVEAEIEGCIDFYKDLKDDLGRQRIIRNGYNPEREIQTGIGQIKVKVPVAETDSLTENQFVSPPVYCRLIYVGPEVWKNCCPGCI